MAEVAFVVVAKAPQAGKVKTRLCPPLNYEQATALYTGFLLDTIAIASQIAGADVLLVCPSPEDITILQKLVPPTVGYILQSEPGLTAALTDSFRQALGQGYRKVFCISSDNPTLPLAYLEQGVAALNEVPVVFGPSEDGGYYLVGAQAVHPFLFSDMTWSVETVLGESLLRAEQAQLATQLLPLWYDLDTGRELGRFIKELTPNGTDAFYTRQALDLIKAELDGLF